MIARLTGIVVEKEADRLILDVGGVGYLATVPLGTMARVGEPGAEVSLHIHTHVREDSLALFGFLTGLERELFERLRVVPDGLSVEWCSSHASPPNNTDAAGEGP